LKLVTIYVLVATAVHSLIVLLAVALRPHLSAGAGEKALRRGLAVLIATIALWFARETR
jgi:hypothetical protein